MMTTSNKLTDESSDRKYFIQVPQIVMALCRNPYDFTLWCVIKAVAGEHGTCTMSVSDLSILAMMSVGKAVDSRNYLLKVGLLEGSIYKDPEYPQPVWHLRIPDIWLKNVEWRQLYDSLKDRVELKAKLKAIFEEADIYRKFDPESFDLIDSLQDVNVKSLHNMKPSQNEEGTPQNEEGTPQNEEGTPQNETKKNHVEPDRTKNKNHGSASKPKRKVVKDKPPTPSQEMFSALAAVCKYDLKVITAKVRGQLNQTEKKLREGEKTPAQVAAFEAWWYDHDWRGKKGQAPTLTQVLETWGQFEANVNGGSNNDNPNPYRNSTIAGLRERAIDNPIKKRFNTTTGETYWFDVRTQQRVDPPG